MRHCLFLLMLAAFATGAKAQSLTAESTELNTIRIRTDMSGMRLLAGWGALNTVGGIAGFATANDEELRHFYQMNAAWGVVNLSIAGLSYFGARRELSKKYDCNRALHRYESTRRLYVLNAGLDALYIGTGFFLKERAKSANGNRPMLRGFGNSLLLQGAGLLLFDASMYLRHSRQSKRWYKALSGICMTGDGIGWQCPL